MGELIKWSLRIAIWPISEIASCELLETLFSILKDSKTIVFFFLEQNKQKLFIFNKENLYFLKFNWSLL